MCHVAGIHHMGGNGLDVTEVTPFCSCDVAVTHQRHLITIDADDPMRHVSASPHPGQNHVAHLHICRLCEHDTFLIANDKRQHAVASDRQCHASPLTHQSYGFLYDIVVVHSAMCLNLCPHNSPLPLLSFGICYEGGLDEKGHEADTRTPAQRAALIALLRSLKIDYPDAEIMGHCELEGDHKACPSFNCLEYRDYFDMLNQ